MSEWKGKKCSKINVALPTSNYLHSANHWMEWNNGGMECIELRMKQCGTPLLSRNVICWMNEWKERMKWINEAKQSKWPAPPFAALHHQIHFTPFSHSIYLISFRLRWRSRLSQIKLKESFAPALAPLFLHLILIFVYFWSVASIHFSI